MSQTVPKLNTYYVKIKHTLSQTMKGMEGEADANNDNKITAGELHSYAQMLS